MTNVKKTKDVPDHHSAGSIVHTPDSFARAVLVHALDVSAKRKTDSQQLKDGRRRFVLPATIVVDVYEPETGGPQERGRQMSTICMTTCVEDEATLTSHCDTYCITAETGS